MGIIIAGGGQVGYQFAQELANKQDIRVIEEDPDEARRFDRLDVQVIIGSPTHPKTLRAAQLTEADTFIACSESDEQNLIACLAAKRVSGARTFCFVSKEEYYRSFTSHNGQESALDIDRIIWPQYMLAEEIARIVLVPGAIDVETFASGRIWLLEYRLEGASRLLGKPLAKLHLPRGVLAVAVTRGERLYIPSGTTELRRDDKVVFMGTQGSLRKLVRRFIDPAPQKVRDVAIIGGGNVGFVLARILEQEEDLRLKIIERSRERCQELAATLKSALILNGDGTDLELLEAEQIYRSDVLVSVTSDDEKNLLCSLLARQMKVSKIITRVDKPANIRLFEGVGIDVPLNPRLTAIKTVISSLRERNIHFLAAIEQGRGEVLELTVPPAWPARKLKDIPRFKGAIIGAIVRNQRTLIPHGEDTIEPGDHLLVFCTKEASDKVAQAF